MFKDLRYRDVTFGVAGLIFAVCMSCFGLNQQGSKKVPADKKTSTELTIQLTASHSLVKLPPRRADLAPLNCELTEKEVKLTATAPHKAELNFAWQVPVGRLIGTGREVTWDLSGVDEGTYTATVEASDRQKHTASSSITVTVDICPGWLPDPPPCPVVSVSCPSSLESKGSVTFEATVSGGYTEKTPTYEWSLTAGKIVSGQATPKIKVDASDLRQDGITATVSVGGFDPLCATVASCSIIIGEAKLK
jgi:hypothetical protein